MVKGLLSRPPAGLVAILAVAVFAGCATSAPDRGCKAVYTLGEPEVAQAIARGQHVTKPGPLPAHAVPKSAPRALLEPDGSYAGGRVFCSVAEARTAAAELVKDGALPKDKPWRVYEVAATWAKDVYEKRPGDYRLKRPAQMTHVGQ
jgi:hypothetical protein